MNRLYRSKTNRIFAGVCGGLGDYFNVDPVLIRLIWFASIFAWGTGLLVYIIAAIIIPNEPIGYTREREEEYRQYGSFNQESTKNSTSQKINNKDEGNPEIFKAIVAIIIIFVGASLLFNIFVPFDFFAKAWKILISIILISLGGYMMYSSVKGRK
ncbi:MAG: phage shock protein [Oceanotoga sp.]|jgi:phage shock protein C|uniref:Phage shock protein C (PspC) family protein n=1 Tax=Oceanotoga teriensis TaxID=515440 RepID=A0AA45C856_9BACT|nr:MULTISPECIES: PspC domain-containing protein [Oceanotoga]MDN5341154.1 phage shock protein [Oceanotoga sp.]PWJ95912.1 phage shock protein C (PspC) family protein [Oceanotoga teriensis]